MGGSAPRNLGSPAPVFSWKLLEPCLCHSEKYSLSIHLGFSYIYIAQKEPIAVQYLLGGWGARPPKTPPWKILTPSISLTKVPSIQIYKHLLPNFYTERVYCSLSTYETDRHTDRQTDTHTQRRCSFQ